MVMEFDFKGKKSSNILALAYDEKTKTLKAIFKGNREYHYYKVPVSVAITLQDRIFQGESIGKNFNALILDAGYDYSEVENNG